MSTGSIERELLGARLRQLVGWFKRAVAADDGRRIWVRGEFSATLRPVPDELDVVLIYDRAAIGSPDRWVMQLLAGGPIVLHPGRLLVTAIGHNDGTREIDHEARRSAVRVQDRVTGDHLVTGWLETTDGGAG